MKLTRYDEEKIASEYDGGEHPFFTQDLEPLNTTDAINWLEEGAMNAIVSEIHGGIIGYFHRDYADQITTILNLHAIDRKLNTQ